MQVCNQTNTNDVPYLRILGIMEKSPYLDLFQITVVLSTLYTEVIWERGLHTMLQINNHKQPEINFDMLNVFSLFQVHAIARFMGSRILTNSFYEDYCC